MIKARSSHRGVLWKKLFLKISQYSQENTCAGVSFWLSLLKRDFNTGVFIWRNIKSTCFEERLRTTASHGRHWYSTNEVLLTIEIKWKFLHFLSADFFRLYNFLRNLYIYARIVTNLQILLMYEAVFKCNKRSASL